MPVAAYVAEHARPTADAVLDRVNLRERADVVRTALDAGMADATALLAARADAAALALDAAAALVSADGGRGVVRGSDSERLFREAAFVLVAASRPELKTALLHRFSGT